MPNTTSKTSILDRAAQMLGMAKISAPNQVGSRTARALERAYTPVLLAELTANFWHFAIKRAQIAASTTAPVHTKGYAYKLPGGFLSLAPEDQYGDFPRANDWIVEDGHIISDDSGPILIRFVSSDVDPTDFDALFAEAFSSALAMETCEELTNSNTKLQNLSALYQAKIDFAKRRGAIVNPKQRLPVSPWISKRG